MEEQESQPGSSSSLFQLNLDIANSYSLRSAGSWAKVVGVVGIVVGILFIMIAVITLNPPPATYGGGKEGFEDLLATDKTAAGLGAAIFIITGVIFIISAIFSFSFGSRILNALKSNDQNGLERGFAALRNYYALRAIVLIIIALILLISFAGAI